MTDREHHPYPRIEYNTHNPPLSAEALVAAFEGRRPTLPASDSFIAWRKYIEDDAYGDESFGGPFTLKKPNETGPANAAVYPTDVTTLQDAYGYVYEYLREFYEKDAPWGTADDDVLDALERVINLVKAATGYEDAGSSLENS